MSITKWAMDHLFGVEETLDDQQLLQEVGRLQRSLDAHKQAYEVELGQYRAEIARLHREIGAILSRSEVTA